MTYDISDDDMKLAKHPHELFLINLIFNHILVFAAALGVATSYPFMLIPIPAFSAAVLIYTLWRARKSLEIDPWFAKCHWQVAARRSRLFLGLLGGVTLIISVILLATGGHPKPQHWALLGAIILPTMVTILILIVMETESLQQARHAIVPQWVADRYPEGRAQPLTESA